MTGNQEAWGLVTWEDSMTVNFKGIQKKNSPYVKEILRNQYESQRMELNLCELGDWWMALWMGNPEYQLSYICD